VMLENSNNDLRRPNSMSADFTDVRTLGALALRSSVLKGGCFDLKDFIQNKIHVQVKKERKENNERREQQE
jgi:hypothetical protein